MYKLLHTRLHTWLLGLQKPSTFRHLVSRFLMGLNVYRVLAFRADDRLIPVSAGLLASSCHNLLCLFIRCCLLAHRQAKDHRPRNAMLMHQLAQAQQQQSSSSGNHQPSEEANDPHGNYAADPAGQFAWLEEQLQQARHWVRHGAEAEMGSGTLRSAWKWRYCIVLGSGDIA